jgi:hypothetical protein
MSTTTATSSKQPVGQTTRAAEPTMSKDVVNMATMEVTEQGAPGQVAPSRIF